MASRFKTAPVPSGEVARYTSDPYNLSALYMFGSSSPFTGTGNTIVRPNDDLLISKGGNRALVVYQRLLYDEQVQACFRKLMQEITSRPWYVQQYSDKPGDLAVRDFVAEVLEEINIDDIYAGMAEAAITGFSVGEVMWKKTKRGVIPFDVRMRDQRRFVFQEQEDAQTGFVMRCLTFNRMFEGVELPERKFIVSRYFVSHNGDPYGAALGRILYPLVKFRRRAIESYVLYGDRYATPTAVAKAPLSASTRELDTLYGHLSNLSQETAMILPEGYELEFLNPSGSPDVFKNLIDYIDREISLVICGENEAGQAEAGSRASSQVANTVRVVRASELSEMLSKTLTQTLIRWIVDLNFGTDVAAPYLTREFRIEESTLTMPDVALMIQSGYTPRKEWIERHFRVELQQKDADTIPLADATPPDQAEDTAPEEEGGGEEEMDEDMLKSIFGDDWNVPEEDEEGSTEEEPAAKEDEEVAEEEPAKGEAPAEKKPTKKAPVEEKSPAEVPTKKATEAKKEKAPAEPPVKKAPVKNEAPKETDMVLVDSDGNVVPEGEYVTDEEGNFMDTQGNPLTPVQKPSKAKKPFGKEKITEDEAVEESKGK